MRLKRAWALRRLLVGQAVPGRWAFVRLLALEFPFLSFLLGLWIVASAVLPLVMLVAMGELVSRLPAAAHSHQFSSPAGHRLVTALVIFGALYAVSVTLGSLLSGLQTHWRLKLMYRLQHRVMHAVSDPPGIAHLEQPQTLDDIEFVQGFLGNYFPGDGPGLFGEATAQRLTGLAALVFIGVFQWWVAVALFVLWQAVRPIYRGVMNGITAGFAAEAPTLRRARYFDRLVVESQGAKEVRVFGIGGWLIQQFRDHMVAGYRPVWRAYGRSYATGPLVAAVAIAVMVGVGIELTHLTLVGAITLGSLAAILNLLFLTTFWGTTTLEELRFELVARSIPHLSSLEHYLTSATQKLRGGLDATALPLGLIRFERVSFGYPGSKSPVLSGLDLELVAGRSLAIVGANGAGKTTLVKLLARLYEPNGGTITVDGLALSDLDPASWRRRLSVVFQDFNRYPLSLRENVALGSIGHLDDEGGLAEAARLADLTSVVDDLPQSWDTVLTKELPGGADLSGGQWQKVALARALFAARHGAKVLVLDEPTAWLDVRGEGQFYARFLEITDGLTTVIISHRFSTVRLADRIGVLEGGKITESGTHTELLALGGRYARMFSLQAERFQEVPLGEGEA